MVARLNRWLNLRRRRRVATALLLTNLCLLASVAWVIPHPVPVRQELRSCMPIPLAKWIRSVSERSWSSCLLWPGPLAKFLLPRYLEFLEGGVPSSSLYGTPLPYPKPSPKPPSMPVRPCAAASAATAAAAAAATAAAATAAADAAFSGAGNPRRRRRWRRQLPTSPLPSPSPSISPSTSPPTSYPQSSSLYILGLYYYSTNSHPLCYQQSSPLSSTSSTLTARAASP